MGFHFNKHAIILYNYSINFSNFIYIPCIPPFLTFMEKFLNLFMPHYLITHKSFSQRCFPWDNLGGPEKDRDFV